MVINIIFFFLLDQKETKNQEKVIGLRTSKRAPATFSGLRAHWISILINFSSFLPKSYIAEIKTIKKTLFFFFITINLMSQNTDIDLLRKINVGRNKNFDNAFLGVSHSVVPASLLAPLSVYGVGLIKHDSTIKNKGLFIGATLLLTTGISVGMKYGINRNRPYQSYTFIDNNTKPHTPSFPSGHTSTAFSTATSLSLAFPKWYVIAPSFLWASSVGYSRMHLGVHYPSDVLAGAIVGAGSAFVCYKANQWIYKRKKK